MKTPDYSHEQTRELLRRTVGQFTVVVIDRVEKQNQDGKYAILCNGKAVRWYGMESAALRAANRFRLVTLPSGTISYSFGESVGCSGMR